MNVFEHTTIENKALPKEWQDQTSLDELLDFLQANWEQRESLYSDGQTSGKQQFIEFLGSQGIKTKNYVGTIVFKGQQLNIFPKMFKTYKGENNVDESLLTTTFLMKNLVKWIEYSAKFNFPYLNINCDLANSSDLRELFVSIYIRYVKNALDRGLFFRYEDREENLQTIRGKLDIKDYITKKYPSGQLNRFKCSFSTFEFDNLLNRIVKYTLGLISKTYKRNLNQKILRDLLIKLGDVKDIKCSPSDCDKIQLSKMQSNYRVILSLSKMFLLNDVAEYGFDNSKTFCFLFPTEVLFEGFVGGFIQDAFQKNGVTVKTQPRESLAEKGCLGNKEIDINLTIRPDIVVECQGNRLLVLDTKYKEIDKLENLVNKKLSEEISSSDIYQMFVYSMKIGCKDIFLLYPQYRLEDLEQDILKIKIPIEKESQDEVNISIARIPFVFDNDEEKMKENLLKMFKKIFD